METSNNQTHETRDYKHSSPGKETGKETRLVLLIVIAALAVLILVMGYFLYSFSKDLKKTEEANMLLKEQKVELENKLNSLIVEYDSLMTTNDSINNLLSVEQEKIRRLLKYRASDATKIKMYTKELETLREVMRSYIVQIDSLNMKNQELTAENVMVRSRLRESESDREALSRQAEQLSSQVQLASVLTAKDVVVYPLNKSSKVKDKISKVEKIKVCFTVRENNVAGPGTRDIYMRIIRPDDVVLASDGGNLFEYNGEQVVYSAVRQLEYENKDMDMCIFWENAEMLIPGIYTVILYCEGYEIGYTTFALK
jgi:FtsZ-binding cell division protein ZapB